jgi:hypothetical protein
MTIASAVKLLADALLAVSALYISWLGLRGYYLESRALKSTDPAEAAKLRGDAKTVNAMAGLGNVWVLRAVFLGSVIQIVLGARDLLG